MNKEGKKKRHENPQPVLQNIEELATIPALMMDKTWDHMQVIYSHRINFLDKTIAIINAY